MSNPDESPDELVKLLEDTDDEASESTRLLSYIEQRLEGTHEQLEALQQGLEDETSRTDLQTTCSAVIERHSTLLEEIQRARRHLEPKAPRSLAQFAEEAENAHDMIDMICKSVDHPDIRAIEWGVQGEGTLPNHLRPAVVHLIEGAIEGLAEQGATYLTLRLTTELEAATLEIGESPEAQNMDMLEMPPGAWSDLRERVRQLEGELSVETSWREGTSLTIEIPY